MPTPNRKTIQDHLITSLQGINAANGYKTSVREVIRWIPGPDEAPIWNNGVNNTPLLCCAQLGTERKSYNPSRRINCILPFTIVGYVASEYTGDLNESWRELAAANLEDDIMYACMGTHDLLTRGGQAIQTKITESWTDLGFRVADVGEHRMNLVSVVALGECWYERTTDHS